MCPTFATGWSSPDEQRKIHITPMNVGDWSLKEAINFKCLKPMRSRRHHDCYDIEFPETWDDCRRSGMDSFLFRSGLIPKTVNLRVTAIVLGQGLEIEC